VRSRRHDRGTRSGRGFRLARAAVFAALCVTVSGLGHCLMSGSGVPGWALGYAFASVTAAAWWLTGRQRGGVAVTGASVATQGLVHLLFTGAQALGPGGLPRGASTAAAHGPGAAGMRGMHEWSPGMLAAHAGAAVLCGLWLWRGEVAAWRLARLVAAPVVAPLRRACSAYALGAAVRRPRRVVPAARPPVRAGAGAVLRHALVRRGPPAVAVTSSPAPGPPGRPLRGRAPRGPGRV
jgi:hypothetical protein